LYICVEHKREAMETAALTLTANADILAQEYETDAVVAAFLAEQDCTEGSRRVYGRCIRQYFAWVRRTGRMLNAMTRADILIYRDGLTDGTATEDGTARSSMTTSLYLTAVKLFYKWLHAHDGSIADIAAGVKAPKRTKKFEREPLTETEAHTLITTTGETATLRDTAIITLLLKTGMRTIEVARANIEDMQVKCGAVVLLVQGKGHSSKDNFVRLSEQTRAAIADYLATRPNAEGTEPLFTSDSHNNRGGRLTTRTISGIAKEHLKAIGLNSRAYTAHSLRHTYGCAVLDATDDFSLTQLELRHENEATTRIYTYHRDEMRRMKAAEVFNIDKIY